MDKKLLKDLYESGLSMSEIAKRQRKSIHSISYWMDKYSLKRRSWSEATYIKRNPNGDPFKIINLDSPEKAELFNLGIGLFLGEGSKRQRYGIRLANSNPEIVNIFLAFLKSICGVQIVKIHAWINMFDDTKQEECLNYWSEATGISKNNFYSPIIRPRKVGNYKNKSEFGTITVMVNNKKLREQMQIWCDIYTEKYAGVA